jgi:hypothetical protein
VVGWVDFGLVGWFWLDGGGGERMVWLDVVRLFKCL